MIEDVFLDRAPEGSVTYNAFGRTHVEALSQYAQLIGDLAAALRTDASRLNPAGAVYSPFAITYGFCADVLSNIALDALHAQPTFGLTLEDVFRTTAHLDHKRARVDGWGKLPTHPGEREHFGHSLEWGVAIFERVMAGLAARGAHAFDANASALPFQRVRYRATGKKGDTSPAPNQTDTGSRFRRFSLLRSYVRGKTRRSRMYRPRWSTFCDLPARLLWWLRPERQATLQATRTVDRHGLPAPRHADQNRVAA
jgi:hypothetical protein